MEMNQLDEFFEIQVDKGKMVATLLQKIRLDEETVLTEEDLKNFIREHGIVYGLKEAELVKILTEDVSYPIVIAEGLKPINGENAFLRPILPKTEAIQSKDDLLKVDLKQVINIPSVTHGQLIGEKVPATNGTLGMNVFGEELPPKPGKDFKLRAGKNTRIEENGLQLFATIDGQMSVEAKVIHVYPIFEVNGDLDLKVGNISFIGSVNIRGNVPAGFEVKAKGDIKVHGTVESAILISEGSIFVSAGIVGQGKGLIKASGDLHTSFINQATVEVDGDINVVQSILHSKLQAGGSVYCNKGKGNIVGGHISAGKNIFVKDLGNSHNTQTSLYLGVRQDIMQKEKLYRDNLTKAEEELKKLAILLNNLMEKDKHGTLSANEKIMKLRVRNTIILTNETLIQAKEKLEDVKDLFDHDESSSVMIERQVFPNVDLHFGKYRRRIISTHQYVKVHLENGEIVIVSL